MVMANLYLVWVFSHFPSGQTIAVVHDSGRITLHSVQDGRVELSLSAHLSLGASYNTPRVAAVWWFPGYRAPTSGVIPDIFKRGGTKVCSPFYLVYMEYTSQIRVDWFSTVNSENITSAGPPKGSRRKCDVSSYASDEMIYDASAALPTCLLSKERRQGLLNTHPSLM